MKKYAISKKPLLLQQETIRLLTITEASNARGGEEQPNVPKTTTSSCCTAAFETECAPPAGG